MTKIKNFRITLRPREIARWLKHQRQMQTTPELDASIEHALQDVKRLLQPAAVYTTLTRATAQKTAPLDFPQNAIAVSLIAVTLGSRLEGDRAAAQDHQDAFQEAMLAALQQEALSQSVQFVVRLLQDQAKEEDCELGVPLLLEGAESLRSLGALLSTSRIGIELDAAAPQLPPYARVAWIFWMPLMPAGSRRNESASAAGKAARAEKAGV